MTPATTAAGGFATPKLPKFLVLDASSIENAVETEKVRNYIRDARIVYDFPDNLAEVPVREECRALCDLENFDVMYDLTMQYLTGKTLVVSIINDDGSKEELGRTYVRDKNFDLRVMDCVSEYPWVVYWLTEFMAGYLSKKFPLPLSEAAQKVAKKKAKAEKQKN